MLRNLMNVLRKGDLVDQAIKETADMFTDAKAVFTGAVASLKSKSEPGFDIYKRDRRINDAEKSIRRKVLENMSINPRQDIVASLVLTSIIIDIERIGDYSKNVYELNNLCSKKTSTIDSELFQMADSIADQFDSLNKALVEGNTQVGQTLMDTLDPIRKESEKYICTIATKKDITVEEAVINVLFARYLKRVAAHLENIASSIANPFDKIGFYKKQEIE